MAKYVVHETDERMFYLKEMLENDEPERTVHVFAPNVLLTAKVLSSVTGPCSIVGGRADNEAKALFNSLDITYYNILSSEEFQAANARMTAEGTLAAVIDRSSLSLSDVKALIIGFGRTGAAVAKIFSDNNVIFDVATTASVRPAYAFARRAVPAENFDFSGYDVIINTIPVSVISDKEIMTFKQSAVYIDLASSPALNLEYARYLGIDADVYPVIPARTSPISAAAAMEKYIREVIR